jgi:hypothetical protein
MIITKTCLPRRSILRGFGTAVALPFLDGMVPALSALSKTPANAPRRLGIVYVPNGMILERWTPAAEGTAFEFTPTLQSLAPFRDRLLVLSGLALKPADLRPGESGGAHARPSGAFLTGAHPKRTTSSELQAGVSIDQIAAKALGAISYRAIPRRCMSKYNGSVWRSGTRPTLSAIHPPGLTVAISLVRGL